MKLTEYQKPDLWHGTVFCFRPKKKVVSCCKKLNKKCSYKSGDDMEILCELAYWLYIYDQKDEVFAVAAETHNIPFVRNFNVWTWIFAIWGLEIRIWKERDCHQQAETLIAAMRYLPTHIVPTGSALRKKPPRRGRTSCVCPPCIA